MENFLNKKNIVYTLSGSTGIITALVSNLLPKSKVLISNNICSRVLESIILSNMIPVIVNPQNGLTIMNYDISIIAKKIKIDSVILVHNYGVESDTEIIRKNNKDLLIIEDCAQHFNKKSIGLYSDIVISSVDINKPLNGQHFGIVGYDDNMKINLNYGLETRYKPVIMCPFALTENPTEKYIKQIIKQMDQNVNNFNKNLIKLKKAISKYDFISYPNFGEKCHSIKFAIIFKNKKYYEKFIQIADKYNFMYSEPHEKPLEKLPMLKKYEYIFIDNNVDNKYQIHIKLNLLNESYINKIIEILEEVKHGKY